MEAPALSCRGHFLVRHTDLSAPGVPELFQAAMNIYLQASSPAPETISVTTSASIVFGLKVKRS